MAVRLDVVFLAFLFVARFASSQIIVPTDKGLVSGKSEEINGATVHSFLGIPYVQPPIGQLRFMPPAPLTSSWNGVLNGSQYKNSCPQAMPIFGVSPDLPQAKINEDCLYINVVTTKPTAAANMSVLVWIHGGGFVTGSGANWDMQTLAVTEGIVIVTMNYRLSVFGFLTSGHESPNSNAIPPNLGILDQQMALRWVQNNIENFGGKKDAVTLAGFSAGSFSTGLHIVTPSSQGLFRYAIMNSAAVLDSFTYDTMASARQAFLKFAKQAGCNGTLNATTQCVRKLSMQQILEAGSRIGAQEFGIFGITVDGKLIPEDPRKLWQKGQFHKGKLLMGTAAQDGYINIPPRLTVTRPAFIGAVHFTFAKIYNSLGIDTIINRYTDYNAVNSPLSNRHQLGELVTDGLFLAPIDFVAQYHSAYSPTYAYVFSHRTIQEGYFPLFMGATHGMDIPYIFGYPVRKPKGFLSNFTTAEAELSKDMMALWGNFIRNGDLSSNKISWPEYTAGNRYYMNITTQSFTPITNYKRNQIAFFNNFINPQFLPIYQSNVVNTVNPSSPTQSSTVVTTTTVTHSSTFEVATYALIGVSTVLGLIVVILLILYRRHRK